MTWGNSRGPIHWALEPRLERRLTLPQGASRTYPTIKAVAILEAMASALRPLSITELGVLLGIPKPTVHRIVRMLEGEGLLQREPGDRRFVPGARLVRLGLDIIASSTQLGPRHAILAALSAEIGETCNFGVMAGNHVVYLDRVESAWPFGLRFEPGSRVPLHCTSMGKLFLSLLPSHKRAMLLRAAPLYRYTANTVTDLDALEGELDRIRETGISTDNQEFLAGVVCVSVSVATASDRSIAALAISAPIARMSLQQALKYVPSLRGAAARLSETIVETERPPAIPRRKRRGRSA
jgi:IclR family acetate operon transcriptional repressor